MKNGQFPEVIQLANFDSSMGYVIQDSSTSFIGWSVGGGKDINGDSYPDVLVGAHAIQAGGYGGYVVFGGSEVGKDGLVKLSDLNGSNGFGFTGEANANIDYVVNTAGDINDDGYQDIIIGAPTASPNNQYQSGQSYIIFGGQEVGARVILSIYRALMVRMVLEWMVNCAVIKAVIQ